MTDNPQPETALALLYWHGLPEDVIDGALALFAQELAGKIRAHRDHTRGAVQATKVMDFAADLISPENWARPEPAAVPSAPADRAARTAEAAVERVRSVLESEAVVGRSALDYRGLITSALMADEAQQPEAQAADRAAIIAEILPAWEAVYEPGSVSDYLIGYANDEAPAKAAAEAWMRSQAEVTGRLEWVPDEQLATGRYDRWFELIERHDGGIDTGPGLIVRRRVEPAAVSQPGKEA